MHLSLLPSGRNFLQDDPLTLRYWDQTVLQLGFTASAVKNIISGQTVALNGGASVSPNFALPGSPGALKLAGINSYGSLPFDAALNLGTGDFTIEWFEKVDSLVAGADGTKMVPVIYWGTWAAPNKPLNLDLFINTSSSEFDMAASSHAGSNYLNPKLAQALSLTNVEHFAVVRKNQVASVYRNGKRIATANYGVSVGSNNAQTVGNINIGRRIGGNSADVFWGFNGYFPGMRITKAARYAGDQFTVPAYFPVKTN